MKRLLVVALLASTLGACSVRSLTVAQRPLLSTSARFEMVEPATPRADVPAIEVLDATPFLALSEPPVALAEAPGEAEAREQLIILSGPPRPRVPPAAGGGGLTPDHTASSCSTAHVSAMFDLLDEGEVGLIPSCPSGQPWTSGITKTFPDDVTIIGAGSLSTLGGGDETVIIDAIASNTYLLNLQGDGLRLAGFTLQGSTDGAYKQNGIWRVIGSNVRIDHCHLDSVGYTGAAAGSAQLIRIYATGVMDNCIIDTYGDSAVYVYNGGGAGGYGDESWATDTNFGQPNGVADGYFFFEDNQINMLAGASPGRSADLFSASRAVFRFNTVNGAAGMEGHHTGHAGDDRGARSMEHYGNQYNTASGLTGTGYATSMADARGGTSLIWGNTMATNALKNGITLGPPTRTNFGTYDIWAEPHGYGLCSGAYKTGTGTLAGDLTAFARTGGDNFNVSWRTGIQAPFFILPIGRFTITSVGSTTAMVVAEARGVTPVAGSGTWTYGSNWDGNTDAYGYPCLDQAGRGKGDLLTGSHPVYPATSPTKVNSALSNTIAWPRQALEPIYVWMNAGAIQSGGGGTYYVQSDYVVSDRDFYAQASAIQTAANTPFDGTTGTGWGPRAQMDLVDKPGAGICTDGVGFFVTDEGSWNSSSSNPKGVNFAGADGRLYKCASNAWTLYYTPYAYPHPLRAGS